MTTLTKQQAWAHACNLDAAYREIDMRDAQGEDMRRAYVDQSTYAILFAPISYLEYSKAATARGFQALSEAAFDALIKAGFKFNDEGQLS